MAGLCPIDSLEEAYLANYGALVRAARPIVGCPARAEDVVQDAYLRLAALNPATDVQQPVSYLFRLVRNLALDRARRLSLERLAGGGEEVPASARSEEPSPEETALARDSLRQLEAALSELPDRTRTIFEMHRIGGFAPAEIAELQGLSLRLVYLLLRDAMTHCRARLYGGEGRP